MKKNKLTAVFAAAILLSGCGKGKALTNELSSPPKQPETEIIQEESENIIDSQMLECRYYSENDFQMYESRAEAYHADGKVICGVIPHHLTAGHMIAGFYKTASESRSDIKTVVIVAPMHYPSENTLCTSETDWAAPFGRLETDNEITAVFKDKLGAPTDDEMMQYDHSVSAHIPFVKKYFPEARAACLLVSPREKEDFPQRLADALSEIAKTKSCLFVFSIDFSHYLTSQAADIHDGETLEAVLSGDTAAIERMTNDNVDSPYCLSAYVRLTKLLDGEITAADNSNTAKVRELPFSGSLFPEGVTSYFVYISS